MTLATTPSLRKTPGALWLALLGLLLAFNAATGPHRILPGGGDAASTKLTAPLPVTAQFRDSGTAIKASAQRQGAFKTQDRPAGDPPIPATGVHVQPPLAVAGSPHRPHAATALIARASTGYHARAPPFSV